MPRFFGRVCACCIKASVGVIFWIPLLMRCILIGRLKTAFEVAGERMSGLGNCWARPPRVRLLLLSQRRFLTDLRLTETGRDWKSIHPRRTCLALLAAIPRVLRQTTEAGSYSAAARCFSTCAGEMWTAPLPALLRLARSSSILCGITPSSRCLDLAAIRVRRPPAGSCEVAGERALQRIVTVEAST